MSREYQVSLSSVRIPSGYAEAYSSRWQARNATTPSDPTSTRSVGDRWTVTREPSAQRATTTPHTWAASCAGRGFFC